MTLPPDYTAGGSLTDNQNASFSPADIAEISERVVEDDVEDFARDDSTVIPTGKIPTITHGKLSSTVQGYLDNAVVNITRVGGEFRLTQNDGTYVSLTAAQLVSALETLTGAARLDASAIQNLPTGGGGTGLTAEQAAELESAVQLEAALRRTAVIISAYRVTQAAGAVGTRLGNVLLPSAEVEREMLISVAGASVGSLTFDLTDLRALPSVAANAVLSSTNALEFQGTNDTKHWVAHGGGNNQIYVASENIGAYDWSATDSRINVTRWVDTANATTDGILTKEDFARIGQGGGGLTAVASDSTLDGAGTAASPLSVAVPLTEGEYKKTVEVDNAFIGRGWIDDESSQVNATTSATRHTASAIAALGGWATSFSQGPTSPDGIYVAVRIPIADRGKADGRHLRLGTFEAGSGTTATPSLMSEITAADFVVANAQYAFYSTQITRLPTGEDVKIQEFDQFHLDPRYIEDRRGLFSELVDRHTQGIAITSAATANRTALFLLSPAYALGDKHGRVTVDLNWHIVSPVGIQLEVDTQDSFGVTLSDLRASTAFDVNAVNGVKVAEVELQSATGTRIGAVAMYLARNSAGNLGYWLNHIVDGGKGRSRRRVCKRHSALRCWRWGRWRRAGGRSPPRVCPRLRTQRLQRT